MIFRAAPVPAEFLDTLNTAHGLCEAYRSRRKAPLLAGLSTTSSGGHSLAVPRWRITPAPGIYLGAETRHALRLKPDHPIGAGQLCLAAGRLNGTSDTLEDLQRSLPDLPSPESLDLPPITATSLRNYVRQLLRAMGGPDPHLNGVEQAWSDLRKAAHNAGCKTSEIWAIGKPTAAQGIPPSRITAADVNEIMRSYRLNSMHATCRKGCTQFDALRGILPDSALPPVPLGIRHVPRRKPVCEMGTASQ